MTSGVLADHQIEALIAAKGIRAATEIDPGQVQPASLDLRLGPCAYRVRASFLPGPTRTVSDRLADFQMPVVVFLSLGKNSKFLIIIFLRSQFRSILVGMAYLNGWIPMLGVQLFALLGMLFSFFTMGDCSFFKLDDRLFFPEDLDPRELPLKVSQTQYVGFLTWQQLDG